MTNMIVPKPINTLRFAFLMLLLFTVGPVVLKGETKSEPTSELEMECSTANLPSNDSESTHHLHTDSYCYIKWNLQMTFTAAKNFCEEIIAPQNLEKSKLIGHVNQKDKLDHLLAVLDIKDDWFWVGGHRNTEGNWVWFDGQSIEPSLPPGNGTGGCVLYKKDEMQNAPDDWCDKQRFQRKFICELAPKNCTATSPIESLPKGVKPFSASDVLPFSIQLVDCNDGFAPPLAAEPVQLKCQAGNWVLQNEGCFKTCDELKLSNANHARSPNVDGKSTYRHKTNTTINCDQGKKFNGETTITVTCKEGRWMKEGGDEVLNAIACITGCTILPNNQLTAPGTNFPVDSGQNVNVQCKDGTSWNDATTDSKSVKCKDGDWETSGLDLTCLPDCTNPESLGFTIDETTTPDKFPYKKQLKVRCKKGYSWKDGQNPQTTITCNSIEWLNTPTCQQNCDLTKNTLHLTLNDGTDLPPKLNHSEQLVVRCANGYSWADEHDGSRLLKCNNSNWSDKLICQIDCPPPTQNDTNLKLIGSKKKFTHNVEVKVVCDENYLFETGDNRQKSITCTNGSWSPDVTCMLAVKFDNTSYALIIVIVAVSVFLVIVVLMIIVCCIRSNCRKRRKAERTQSVKSDRPDGKEEEEPDFIKGEFEGKPNLADHIDNKGGAQQEQRQQQERRQQPPAIRQMIPTGEVKKKKEDEEAAAAEAKSEGVETANEDEYDEEQGEETLEQWDMQVNQIQNQEQPVEQQNAPNLELNIQNENKPEKSKNSEESSSESKSKSDEDEREMGPVHFASPK